MLCWIRKGKQPPSPVNTRVKAVRARNVQHAQGGEQGQKTRSGATNLFSQGYSLGATEASNQHILEGVKKSA